MQNFKLNPFLFFFIVLVFGFQPEAQAQLLIPNGVNWTSHTDPGAYVIIGRNGNLHNNPTDINHKLTVDANTTTYGSRVGIYSIARSIGFTGQSQGVAKSSMSAVGDWFASGTIQGVTGLADSVSILNVEFAGNGSAALGGSFVTRIFDPIQDPNTGTYTIAGSRSILDGNISTFPASGVVAALYADDRINIPGTWGAYIEGDSYISEKVGINCTDLNPSILSSLTTDYRLIVNGGILGTELFHQ